MSNTTWIHTCAHPHTQPHVHTDSLVKMVGASRPLLRPERCSWSGDSKGASRSAVWASLPAPDNFTIPALAGGDNHIKLPLTRGIEFSSGPLKSLAFSSFSWTCCWRYNEKVCIFIFSLHGLLFFFPLFFAADSEMYLGTIWDSMSLGGGIWIGRIECYRHCPVRSVIVSVSSVCHGEFSSLVSSFCQSVLRNIFAKFSWEIPVLCHLEFRLHCVIVTIAMVKAVSVTFHTE